MRYQTKLETYALKQIEIFEKRSDWWNRYISGQQKKWIPVYHE